MFNSLLPPKEIRVIVFLKVLCKNTSNSKIIQSKFFFKTTDDLLRLLLNESPNSPSGREIKSERTLLAYTLKKMINVASANEYSFYIILFIYLSVDLVLNMGGPDLKFCFLP